MEHCVSQGSWSTSEMGSWGIFLPIVDPLRISRMAEATDFKFCVHTEGRGAVTKTAKLGHRGSVRGHVTYF